MRRDRLGGKLVNQLALGLTDHKWRDVRIHDPDPNFLVADLHLQCVAVVSFDDLCARPARMSNPMRTFLSATRFTKAYVALRSIPVRVLMAAP